MPQRDEVSAESAYAAALERVMRTTEALVLAEALVRDRDRTVAEMHAEVVRLREEVGEDGTADDGAEAVGEAVSAHPFSD